MHPGVYSPVLQGYLSRAEVEDRLLRTVQFLLQLSVVKRRRKLDALFRQIPRYYPDPEYSSMILGRLHDLYNDTSEPLQMALFAE